MQLNFMQPMTTASRSLALTLIVAFSLALTSCDSPETIYDLSDSSYILRNTDSTQVTFPDDFSGNLSVITFIYTNCPDVCPVITANMNNIQKQLEDTSGINFIEISFDPQRDTPSVLKKYKDLYNLDDQFTMLTGQPAVIKKLLGKVNIVAEKVFPDSAGQDSSTYSIRHSNYIFLMDGQNRIRAKYPASVVPPENVIEDIQTLRHL